MAVAHRDVAGLLKKRGYLEVKKIGEGSFGKAILVQAKDGTKLVCKMVDISKASAREQRDAMKEGQLLASLKHPYIVRYRENFTDSGWLCILMDFCENGDLTKKVDEARKGRKPFAEDQVLRWLTQGLLALKYIHDRHVLHRDLKPGNFFLSKNVLKMGDFGIAKVLSSTIACAKTQIGTPYYLSPEVCQEKPYAWPSDIWAMGCILYEMTALKVPFDAPNISGLVQKIIRGPVPVVPNTYSDFVRQLCSEMLNRNPNQRPSADDILKRPKMQAIVRQMLDEAHIAEGSPMPEKVKPVVDNGGYPVTAAQAEPGAAAVAVGVAAAAAAHQHAKPVGNCQYKQGDLIEYHSNTHQDWLPASVLQVDALGRVIIDLKPNTWMNPQEQAGKLRPRRGRGGAERGRQPPPRAAPPLSHRSPSADALRQAPARGASPSPQQPRRSPSADAFQPNQWGGAAPSPQPNAQWSPSPRGVADGSPVPKNCYNSPRQPSRGPSPSPPSARGQAASPSPHLAGMQGPGTPRIRPPGIPRQGVDSPFQRKNNAACAAARGVMYNGGA
mmetsp:Transcript_54094/g.142495  ORF Transcript_54094/g.142495 Transcript_54094/m.142495 type:complete len:555 (+) Transcript_54094:115-1779(+)